MKIKVTFRPLGGKDTTVTMEISQGAIADIAKSGCIADIVNEAFAKSGVRARYGSARKIKNRISGSLIPYEYEKEDTYIFNVPILGSRFRSVYINILRTDN